MRDSNSPRRTANSDRGQTTIDFGIGISIFLLTIIFIFAFVPSLFQPFVTDQSQNINADRIADTLVEDMFLEETDDAERYVINKDCTVAFFQTMNDGAPEDTDINCGWEPVPEEIQEYLGLNSVSVNITLEPAAYTSESSSDRVVTIDGTYMRYGEDIPTRGSVVTAQRMVYIPSEETTYRLFVRVW